MTYSKKYREEVLRLTQKELAERLGVSIKTVQSWDQERRKPGQPALKLMQSWK